MRFAISNELEEAFFGISKELEREGAADEAEVISQTRLRVQEEVARLEVALGLAGDATIWHSRMVWEDVAVQAGLEWEVLVEQKEESDDNVELEREDDSNRAADMVKQEVHVAVGVQREQSAVREKDNIVDSFD